MFEEARKLEEIKILEEELRLAMLSSDVKKLDILISDNLVFLGPDGNVATKQMDLHAHAAGLQKMSKLEPSEQNIKLFDNYAVVTVKMHIKGKFGNVDISGNYRYIRNWIKTKVGWKISSGAVMTVSC